MSMASRGNRTAAYTADEWLTSRGQKFTFHKQITIPANTTRYFLCIMPAITDDVRAAFSRRYINAVDGDLNIAINQDVTSDQGAVSAEPIIKENRSLVKANKTNFYDIGTTEPTGGTSIEDDSIKASGSGSNKVGFAFPSNGFRVYAKGDKAAIKLENPDESKEVTVTVAYTWVEV